MSDICVVVGGRKGYVASTVGSRLSVVRMVVVEMTWTVGMSAMTVFLEDWPDVCRWGFFVFVELEDVFVLSDVAAVSGEASTIIITAVVDVIFVIFVVGAEKASIVLCFNSVLALEVVMVSFDR